MTTKRGPFGGGLTRELQGGRCDLCYAETDPGTGMPPEVYLPFMYRVDFLDHRFYVCTDCRKTIEEIARQAGLPDPRTRKLAHRFPPSHPPVLPPDRFVADMEPGFYQVQPRRPS